MNNIKYTDRGNWVPTEKGKLNYASSRARALYEVFETPISTLVNKERSDTSELHFTDTLDGQNDKNREQIQKELESNGDFQRVISDKLTKYLQGVCSKTYLRDPHLFAKTLQSFAKAFNQNLSQVLVRFPTTEEERVNVCNTLLQDENEEQLFESFFALHDSAGRDFKDKGVKKPLKEEIGKMYKNIVKKFNQQLEQSKERIDEFKNSTAAMIGKVVESIQEHTTKLTKKFKDQVNNLLEKQDNKTTNVEEIMEDIFQNGLDSLVENNITALTSSKEEVTVMKERFKVNFIKTLKEIMEQLGDSENENILLYHREFLKLLKDIQSQSSEKDGTVNKEDYEQMLVFMFMFRTGMKDKFENDVYDSKFKNLTSFFSSEDFDNQYEQLKLVA